MNDVVRSISGMCKEGLDKLWITWQLSHLRATEGETAKEKHLRRGSNTADKLANIGRELHENIDKVIMRTKAAYDTAKHWALWAGRQLPCNMTVALTAATMISRRPT